MRDWALTILTCLAFMCVGMPWVRRVPASRPQPLVSWFVAYLFGTALVSLGMLGVAFVGLPVDRLTLILVFVVAGLTGVRGAERPQIPPVRGRLGLWAILALSATAATLAFGVLQAFRLGGIDTLDFLKAWGLKGVAVALDHSLDFSHLSGPNLFYPLELSNVNGAVLLVLGHVNDAVLRLPGALYGVALVVSMWWLLRLVLPPTPAAAAICLTVMTPEFLSSMTGGLADLALAAYVTLCVLAAYLWLLDGGAGWASLSGFAAGAAAWTKLEGALTCLTVLAAVLVVRRALRTPGLSAWIVWFALFTIPWQIFQRIHGIPANRSHFKTIYLHPFWIIDHVARTLAETLHWGLFWPLCLCLIVLSVPLWWRTDLRLLAAVTLPNVVLTMAAYVTHYRAGQAGSVEATAHRLYLHIAPSLAVLAVAGAIGFGARRSAAYRLPGRHAGTGKQPQPYIDAETAAGRPPEPGSEPAP
jgi:hypothetical protein